jgi:general secretion pathway protein L
MVSNQQFFYGKSRPGFFVGGFRARVRAFAAWWLRELADSLPAGLRPTLGSDRADLMLVFSETQVALHQRQGQTWQTIGRATTSLEVGHVAGDTTGDMIRAIRQASLRTAPVAVRMEQGHFLRRMVELPIATAKNLREVFGFEMDRYTPFTAADVYFDFRIVGANPKLQRITVDLAVITRQLAERALSYARAVGLEPAHLGIADEPESDAADFNLLSTRPTRPRRTFRRLAVTLLALAFAALSGAALYLPISQKQDSLAAMETRLDKVRIEAQRADRLKALLEQTLKQSQVVVGRQRLRPTAIELLEEITDLLPDDTWIHRLRLHGDDLDLAGYSAKPSALIGILEESPALVGVRFTGAVKPDPRQGLDAFKLSASILPRGQ